MNGAITIIEWKQEIAKERAEKYVVVIIVNLWEFHHVRLSLHFWQEIVPLKSNVASCNYLAWNDLSSARNIKNETVQQSFPPMFSVMIQTQSG